MPNLPSGAELIWLNGSSPSVLDEGLPQAKEDPIERQRPQRAGSGGGVNLARGCRHSSDSHTRVRQEVPKRIEMLDLAHEKAKAEDRADVVVLRHPVHCLLLLADRSQVLRT
jgi:hypothetical protein